MYRAQGGTAGRDANGLRRHIGGTGVCKATNCKCGHGAVSARKVSGRPSTVSNVRKREQHFLQLAESGKSFGQQNAEKGEKLLKKGQNNLVVRQRLEGRKRDILNTMQASCSKRNALLAEAASTDLQQQEMFNEITDLKGKIRVALRMKALLPGEVMNENVRAFKKLEQGIDVGSKVVPGKFFHYWTMEEDQSVVFNDTADFIQSALNGYNVSVIFYGETGSGKTYTMLGGDASHEGIVPRALSFIFSEQKRRLLGGWQINISMRCYEIYMERFRDLLSDKSVVAPRFIDGNFGNEAFASRAVTSSEQALALLNIIANLRTVGATQLNDASSRSHCIFQLEIAVENAAFGNSRTSFLTFVDLAGSERVDESRSVGLRLAEAKFINTSLLSLRNVIRGQYMQEKVIRYRDSKLTQALSGCLGTGNSKTFLIVTLNPTLRSSAETLRSIHFASEACETCIGIATRFVL